MPRLVAPVLALALCSSASAQTVSAIIPMSQGQNSAGGFRDIPPGPQYFQVTIQSNSGSFPLAGLNGGNSQLTWVPQGPVQGVTAVTWTTTTSATESQVGTVGGWAYFMGGPPPGYTVSNFYTTNACFAGGDLTPFNPGTYQDPGDPLRVSNVGALPTTFSADDTTGNDLHSFSISNYHDGDVWFTSDDANVAVYWLDSSSNTWTLLDQPTFFAANGGNFPLVQFAIHVGDGLMGDAAVTLRYRSVDSVNPDGDGDTLDILNIVCDRFPTESTTVDQ